MTCTLDDFCLPYDEVGGSADELRGRFAHALAAAKAHNDRVQQAFQARKVDLALGKGVQPGTIGTDYVSPWDTWYDGFLSFAAANVPTMFTDDDQIGAQLSGYERELRDWIARFQSESGTGTPAVPFEPTPSPTPRPGTPWPWEEGGGGGLGEIKWLVLLGVGLYLVVPALPAIQGAIARAAR